MSAVDSVRTWFGAGAAGVSQAQVDAFRRCERELGKEYTYRV